MSEFEQDLASVMGSFIETELDYIEKSSNELDEVIKERDLYKNVVDEIKKVINNQMDYREFVDIVNAIEEILDKAGNNNE